MKKRAVLFIFLSVLAGLNLGTVRKKDNPILNAQTDPILYEQKKEEEKDGVKGPLLYHVKHDPLETFFIKPPFSSEQHPTGGQPSAQPASAPGDAADWWEEQPTTEEAPSVPSEPSANEPVFQDPGEPIQGEEPLKADSEAPPEAKGEDYWW